MSRAPLLGSSRHDECAGCADLRKQLEAALIAAQTATEQWISLRDELAERRAVVAYAMPSLRNEFGPRFGDLR